MQRRQFNRDQAIVNTMNQFKPQAVSGIDWANALENYNDAYNKAQDKQKQQDLADALIGGDEKQILAARAAYDPVGTANYLDQQQQQQQAREWALADAERNHQWDMDKLATMNNNALGLAKAKAMLESQASGGQSEFSKVLQREQAKNYAAELENQRNLQVMMPKIESDVDRLMELAGTATSTGTGKALDWVASQFGVGTEGAVARAEMENIVENNVLPQLRTLLGAQFTEKEGEKVKQTIMDPNRTPAERRAQLQNFLNSKLDALRQSSQKLQLYGGNEQNSDPLGIL